MLLKVRQEEYNENIFESLLEAQKTLLATEAKKYIYSKEKDPERLQTFVKILINGFYSAKFITRKDCIYTPQKGSPPQN